MKKNQILILVILLITSNIAFGQDSVAVDFLRSTGKLYSVIAGLVIIFIALGVFLFRIDRKLTKLENQVQLKNENPK